MEGFKRLPIILTSHTCIRVEIQEGGLFQNRRGPPKGVPHLQISVNLLVPVKKARKTGGVFGGQNLKNEEKLKKISKIFIVPNRPLGHTDQLYTYKGHIEYVGFTEKRQKPAKIAILC